MFGSIMPEPLAIPAIVTRPPASRIRAGAGSLRVEDYVDLLAAEGAEFTVVNGWERVDYFKPSPEFHETHSFKFNEVFDVVKSEVEAVQTGRDALDRGAREGSGADRR